MKLVEYDVFEFKTSADRLKDPYDRLKLKSVYAVFYY